jgi:hypothetical protein
MDILGIVNNHLFLVFHDVQQEKNGKKKGEVAVD